MKREGNSESILRKREVTEVTRGKAREKERNYRGYSPREESSE
jgi:hypothetical protein